MKNNKMEQSSIKEFQSSILSPKAVISFYFGVSHNSLRRIPIGNQIPIWNQGKGTTTENSHYLECITKL